MISTIFNKNHWLSSVQLSPNGEESILEFPYSCFPPAKFSIPILTMKRLQGYENVFLFTYRRLVWQILLDNIVTPIPYASQSASFQRSVLISGNHSVFAMYLILYVHKHCKLICSRRQHEWQKQRALLGQLTGLLNVIFYEIKRCNETRRETGP